MIQPGPLLFRDESALVWGLIASLYIGNVALLVLDLPLVRIWVKVLQIPRPYLYSGICVFAMLGAYAVNGSVVDLAVLVALGDVTTGAITNDETFLKQLQEASSRVGEKLWQLPSYPEYREMLKSEVADVKNSTSPDRWAGCITGGLFVGAFAGDTPWIHLDIGGTAWLWQEKSLDPKGGSGAMVRSIVELVRQMAGK